MSSVFRLTATIAVFLSAWRVLSLTAVSSLSLVDQAIVCAGLGVLCALIVIKLTEYER